MLRNYTEVGRYEGYDYAGYHRRQYNFPQATQPFCPYQPVQPRRVICWDPPSSRVEVLHPPSWPDPESPYVSHHLDPPDPSRRLSAMTRRGDGQPGLSLRDNPEGSNPPRAFPGSSEIFSAGLEKIMARFDRLESRLESQCKKIDRRVKNLQASKATYTQQPYACYDSRRKLRTRPLPEPPPQPTYTNMDSTYAPPRQYTTSNFGQQPYLSDESPRKPYTGSHRRQHEDRPTPPPYRPPHSPTCWESPQYVPPSPLGCLLPHVVESRRLSRPYLHHDPSSPSLPVVAAVPPPSCCPNLNRDEGELDEGELLHDDPPPPAPILQLCNSDISEEEETLLEDKEEEEDSIGEVEKIMASFNVAQITSKDVENCWFKSGGAYTGVRIIAYIHVDFFDGDVPSIVHRATSLDVDARFIPPRNDTPYLSLLGGDKGRQSAVRYVFDPGGDA